MRLETRDEALRGGGGGRRGEWTMTDCATNKIIDVADATKIELSNFPEWCIFLPETATSQLARCARNDNSGRTPFLSFFSFFKYERQRVIYPKIRAKPY